MEKYSHHNRHRFALGIYYLGACIVAVCDSTLVLQCMPHAWYVSADMQLFLTIPVFVFAYKR